MIHRRLVRPVLFRLDPERAHELAIRGLQAVGPVACRVPGPLTVSDPRLSQTVAGVEFANPVGLAAGFDKSARAVAAWPALGFGFVEIGTVTALAQPGNPRPRMFRLPEDEALINRLGFNNEGSRAVARRLDRARRRGRLGRIRLGVNIGKSKVVPLERAAEDYTESYRRLRGVADYVVVNVSSPNTPGLRELQDREHLAAILGALAQVDEEAGQGAGGRRPPVFVKLAPDLSDTAVDEAVDLALERGIAGLIVANTTIGREDLASPPELVSQAGGLSGRPLAARGTALVRRVYLRAEGRLAVIGVGGIFGPDDAWERIAAGASLVQVYTGLVYEGAGLVRRINRGLLARMDREGVSSVADLVGRG